MRFEYTTEAEDERIMEELLAKKAKHSGARRGRKRAGSDLSKGPKRDRRTPKDDASAEGRARHSADWPALRPLCNLDKVAAKPDAPIVVCEGERAASAAARVFPEWIATTSSGGPHAATGIDWRPVAGRRVLMWPANDHRARRHAREVAVTLAELDCEVSILDAAALAAIDPAGGEREPEGEYDAARALADWKDTAMLRKIVEDLAKSFDPGPIFVSIWPYSMDANGLTIDVERGRGADKCTETLRIAAAFEVLGATRDPHGAGWGKLLRWSDGDGRKHMRHVADKELHSDPGALCASLAHEGLWIDPERQRQFVGYLSAARVKRRLRAVRQTGWHEIEGQSYFVLPDQTLGPRGAEQVILERTVNGVAYEARGTIQEWRDGVAKLAGGHVMPALAISAALAGPLLHLARLEGGGVHFWGGSSIGKTTLLQMGGSVWGRGTESGGYVGTWRTTANGLEGVAASATDTALILDELGLVDPRDAAAVYSLASGAGKHRAGQDGAARKQRTWRALMVSSGEQTIESKLAEDRGRKPKAGQLVRALDIPAERAFGVFDSNGPDGDAASYAKACKAAAQTAYGTAGPEFVRRLIAEGVTGEDVKSRVKAFTEANVPPGADGQVERAAERLGIIAAAGELATQFGLTPWRPGEALEAASLALTLWIEERGGAEPAEVRQAIEQVRLVIEAHGESRFQNVDDRDPDARPVNNRLGWRKGSGDEREWWVLPASWKAEVCNGLDPQRVARVLADRRMLRLQPSGELQCAVKIYGKAAKAYVVTTVILAGGDDDGSDDDAR
jgi:putative DNA primase/helicase